MAIISNIEVKAEDSKTEANINFFNQAIQLYQLLEQALPPGQFKEDALQFAARKREEYLNRITAHDQA